MVGTYLSQIKDHTLQEVGEKRTPCVAITLETVENIQTKEPATQTVYAKLWLTDGALDYTMKTLTEVLGWNGDDLSDLNGTQKFVGKEVWAVLVEEEYNGKIQTKVKFLNKIGGVAKKPMEADVAKSLAERLKGKVLSYRQKNPVEVEDGLPF